MMRVEDDHIASPDHWLDLKQGMPLHCLGAPFRTIHWERSAEDCSKVICKGVHRSVLWIFVSARASISRAEVAGGIVGGLIRFLRLFDLTLPRSLCSMRRDQDVFSEQRIIWGH